jgi:hypothetical protein
MTDMPSGMRVMQTFRKLPMQMPKRKKKRGITVSTVPQEGEALNAGYRESCRMTKESKGRKGLPQRPQRSAEATEALVA